MAIQLSEKVCTGEGVSLMMLVKSVDGQNKYSVQSLMKCVIVSPH